MSRTCRSRCAVWRLLAVVVFPRKARARQKDRRETPNVRPSCWSRVGSDEVAVRDNGGTGALRLGRGRQGALAAGQGHSDPEIRRRATKVLQALDAAKAESAEQRRRAEMPRPDPSGSPS